MRNFYASFGIEAMLALCVLVILALILAPDPGAATVPTFDDSAHSTYVGEGAAPIACATCPGQLPECEHSGIMAPRHAKHGEYLYASVRMLAIREAPRDAHIAVGIVNDAARSVRLGFARSTPLLV